MIETIPQVRPIEVVTPIKPSEALRLGCLMTGPAIGSWHAADGSTCAVGAMEIGFGGWTPEFRAFRERVLTSPVSGWKARSGATLMHLNDVDRWSRKRIADWLESIGL